jgi:hypothetical protein
MSDAGLLRRAAQHNSGGRVRTTNARHLLRSRQRPHETLPPHAVGSPSIDLAVGPPDAVAVASDARHTRPISTGRAD